MKKYGQVITRRIFLGSTVKSVLALSVLPKVLHAEDAEALPRPNYTYLKDLLTPFRQENSYPALAAAVMKNGAVVASGSVGVRKVKGS